MKQAIISTVGTSLLTNGASEETCRLLSRTANLSEAQYEPSDREEVIARAREVERALRAAAPTGVRQMSAELNGIVSLGALGGQSCHYLLCTDTLQGQKTAAMVAAWLRKQRSPVVPIVLDGFSTATREAFARGIDFLLRWCAETLPELRDQGMRVVFNLAGSFKSLQAYAQTLGMFYADEIVYIFEGAGADLIRIPRLPIVLETQSLAKHAAEVARMAEGEVVTAGLVPGLPEAYLDPDGSHLTLSEWGRMAWELNHKRLLGEELLLQPGLQFTDGFRRDYAVRRDRTDRVALQQALARASTLWRDGGLQALRRDGGLLYEDLYSDGAGHFRVTQSVRVSCRPEGSLLVLRYFGSHEYVIHRP